MVRAVGGVDKTVKRETGYIALWVLVLSLLMEAVFLVLRRWSLPVLFGNLLGGGVAVLNFFLMGLTVQKAVDKDEKQAANAMRLSQSLRLVMLFAAAALGALLACFNVLATLIPLFFPRIAVALRPLFDRKEPAMPDEAKTEEEVKDT